METGHCELNATARLPAGNPKISRAVHELALGISDTPVPHPTGAMGGSCNACRKSRISDAASIALIKKDAPCSALRFIE